MKYKPLCENVRAALCLTPLGLLPLAGCPGQPTGDGAVIVPAAPVAPAHAAVTGQDKALPAGGVALLPAESLGAFSASNRADAVKVERVPVEGQPFKEALRLTTLQKSANVWDVQLSATATQGVKKGDTLLATFYVRSVKGQAETGEARTALVFERGEEPYTKSVDYDVRIPARGWKRFDVPFKAGEDLPQNLSKMHFRLGYDPQAFEIGGISLTKWGPEVALKDLPRTRASYVGMEADAKWRAEAEARIEKIRKGDIRLTVTDAGGKPIPNATVEVRMTRHAFPFGSAVAAEMLLKQDADGEKYRALVKEMFNRVVMENDLKWPDWESYSKPNAIAGVKWLREQNIEVRGHNLVWPGWRWLPQDLPNLKNDPAKLAKRIDDHITDVTTAMRGQLVDWDVINETFANHDLMDILGRESMIGWFKLAKKNDPKARLFLNDYPPLDGGDTANKHLNDFYETITYLKEKGAPIEGIGFQCHFGGNVIAPTRLLSGLDRFAKLKLPIAVTEFDVNTTDEEFQAAYTRDFTIALFSHPAVDSILMWGFWEGRHWLPDAALYRRDWTLKPNGAAFRDLVLNRWRTKADGKTDGKGTYALRGFLGDYEAKVTTPTGATATVRFTLGRKGASPKVKL
jgi:endo-1,4-beta-xylanase